MNPKDEAAIVLAMSKLDKDSQEYAVLNDWLMKLQECREKELRIEAQKADAEVELQREELKIKKQDSKRRFWGTVITAAAAVGQLLTAIFAEETRSLGSKVFQYVSKPRL